MRVVSPGFEPAGFVSPRAGSTKEVTARSLPPKMFPGETRRSPLEPFRLRRLRDKPALVFAADVCRRGTGIG